MVARQRTWEIMKYVKALLLVGMSISPAFFNSALGHDGFAPSPTHPLVEAGCEDRPCIADAELGRARAYLVETARPGGTMMRQGSDLAIERLHPEFAKRLAGAIQAARRAGLADAGIFSAYRPPVFGIGGFADKYYSLHAYGLAVDMHGIGGPGSPEAQRWHEIAAGYGIVCPYGYQNRLEWNHCQPTHLWSVKAENPLRDTIAGSGPLDLNRMFEVGNRFIADVRGTIATVVAQRITLAAVNTTGAPLALGRQARGSQRATPSTRVRASRLTHRHGRSPSKSVRSSRTKLALLTKRPK